MEKHKFSQEPSEHRMLRRHGRTLLTAGCLVVAVSAILVAFGWGIVCWIPDWPTRGQFGDMFGFINALFSGLALAAVAWTLVLQREELKLQREELAATREEVRRSVQAQQALAAATEQNLALARRASSEAERRSIATATPRFTCRVGRGLGGVLRIVLTLLTERITDVVATSDQEGVALKVQEGTILSTGKEIWCDVKDPEAKTVAFVLTYVDCETRDRATRFVIHCGKRRVVHTIELPASSCYEGDLRDGEA